MLNLDRRVSALIDIKQVVGGETWVGGEGIESGWLNNISKLMASVQMENGANGSRISTVAILIVIVLVIITVNGYCELQIVSACPGTCL